MCGCSSMMVSVLMQGGRRCGRDGSSGGQEECKDCEREVHDGLRE